MKKLIIVVNSLLVILLLFAVASLDNYQYSTFKLKHFPSREYQNDLVNNGHNNSQVTMKPFPYVLLF